MLELYSKLPNQGVTIFSTMSQLAQQLGALNLSQGFPDFAPPQALLQALSHANFCGVTPVQSALAEFMLQHPEHIQGLSAFYQQKRDLFNAGLKASRFKFSPSQGTYFQNLDYSAIRPDLDDVAMCQWLAHQHGIVAIPISVFYQAAPQDLRLIRFCFAKQDQTLIRAAEILSCC